MDLLDKDTFITLAKSVGLDVTDKHIDYLFPMVQAVFSNLRHLQGLNNSTMESALVFDVTGKKTQREMEEEYAAAAWQEEDDEE
jgi:hypothetical protein